MADTNAAPPAAKPKAKESPARLIPPIMPERMKATEHNTMSYDIVLYAGTEPDDLLPVQFWSHLAHTFAAAKRQGDVILNVKTEDERWRARLEVVQAGTNWAKVVFLAPDAEDPRIVKLGGIQQQNIVLLPGHTVNFNGVFDKWRVVREADGQVLSRNHRTEMDAYSWLAEYAKSVAA